MAQWQEHLPFNMAWVHVPALTPYYGLVCFWFSSMLWEVFSSCTPVFSLSSRTKPEKTVATAGFPENWLLRNERENSILILLGSASDWLKICFIQSDALPRQHTVNQKIRFSPKNGAVSLSKIQSDPRAEMSEMGTSVGWRTLLIELFWPKLGSNGSRRGWIGHWPAGLNWHFGAETEWSF